MWRSVRHAATKYPARLSTAQARRLYASEQTGSTHGQSSGGGKAIAGIITAAGLGFAGAVVYGKYDPDFKNLLEDNIPYMKTVYKLLPDWGQKSNLPQKETPLADEKIKQSAISVGLLKKKQDRLKSTASEDEKPALVLDPKLDTIVKAKDDKIFNKSTSVDEKPFDQNLILKDIIVEKPTENEKLKDMLQTLEKSAQDAVSTHKAAVDAVQNHTKKIYEALDLPEGKEGDIIWKEASDASIKRNSALNLATQKASDTKFILENLKNKIKRIGEKDAQNPILKLSEDTIARTSHQLRDAEAEVAAAQLEAKTAAEYKDLVNTSKEQFRKELQIVLPKYLHGDKDKSVTEDELNLLIAHAHRRIEQLQKQLAKQQVKEKFRVDQAIHHQKMEDKRLSDTRIEAEMERREMDLESAVEKRVAGLKDEFEVELRQQLRRQAAAHADHLQEVLKVQQQELDRKHTLEIEEKLLHQKGVFISELAGSMAHLKGIVGYMKAKGEFDKLSKKAQALWLACQSMDHKINTGMMGNPCPLGKEVAALQIAAVEDSEFVSAILAGIPTEAVNRGVFTNESLKQRFQKVKRICCRVAIIDEDNNSLYQYLLSYLQSFLIVDAMSIPKEELEGKVAVDPSEWDTFDILSRVSYCLKIDDLEQALRYANQLKGEPRTVAKEWMDEVRLLLETKLAVKALLTHAAAIGVQAYH